MINTLVTDIEGTTSSLAFVKDTLFPYARRQLADFVRTHAGDPTVSGLLEDTARLASLPHDIERLIDQLIRWIDEDQKITPLKSLQGLIWQDGYERGDFKGHIYDDAVEALRNWKHQGIDLYVYSSGSVQAQKLLFAHTEYGDLTALFSGYFDTHIGGKKESASYRAIAEHIGRSPQNILFLSDIVEELDAARAAGYQTYRLAREEVPPSPCEHATVSNFAEIQIDQR